MKSIEAKNYKSVIKQRVEYAEKIVEDSKTHFLTTDEVKYIYGSKGGLRLTYLLDDENKSRSKYRKVCDAIANEYRSLKIEACLNFLEKIDSQELKQTAEDILSSLSGLEKLVDELSLLCAKEDFKNSLKSIRELEEAIKNCNSFIRVSSIVFGAFALGTAIIPPIGAGISVGGAAVTLGTLFYNITQKYNLCLKNKKFKEFLNSENGKELRNKINTAFRTLKGKTGYDSLYVKYENNQKIYEKFVNECGSLAFGYLKKEFSRKLKFINKNIASEDTTTKDKVQLDIWKLIFMSLIAMCSRKENHTDYGKKIYDQVKILKVT